MSILANARGKDRYTNHNTLKILDHLGLSPLSPYHYLTYHKPYYFDSEPAFRALGYRPKYGNRETITEAYDWFVQNYDRLQFDKSASTHKRPVRQGILKLLKAIS